jgi:hypothetical protein
MAVTPEGEVSCAATCRRRSCGPSETPEERRRRTHRTTGAGRHNALRKVQRRCPFPHYIAMARPVTREPPSTAVGSDFGVTKRDRNEAAAALASLMPRWADVQLKDKHTFAVNVYSPLAQEQLRPLGSRLQHERNRIENAHLKDRFVMRDEASNVVRAGPER